jgi:hypothetical protein
VIVILIDTLARRPSVLWATARDDAAARRLRARRAALRPRDQRRLVDVTATASILTARPPYTRTAWSTQASHWLADELKTMAEAFAEAGTRPGVRGEPARVVESNFDQGFHSTISRRGPTRAACWRWRAMDREREGAAFFAYIHLIARIRSTTRRGSPRSVKDDPWHDDGAARREARPRGRTDPRRRAAVVRRGGWRSRTSRSGSSSTG